MKRITERQAEVLTEIITYINEHGYPPTLRWLGKWLGIASTNGVNDHLRALERKGYICRQEDFLSRGIAVIKFPDGQPAMVRVCKKETNQ